MGLKIQRPQSRYMGDSFPGFSISCDDSVHARRLISCADGVFCLTFTTILFKIGNVDSTDADAFGSAAEAT
jgi:hypothetical protein